MSRSQKAPLFIVVCLLAAGSLFAQELAQIALPAPQTRGGKPLMEALALRVTSRAFATTPLPLQTMANILWTAQGMNGPKGADATSGATPIAPSAVGWQEIDVYVVLKAGAYLYDPKAHNLKPVVRGDLRALTGIQPFVKDAPATLVYVADSRRIGYPPGFPQALMDGAELHKELMEWADAALISQNVSLYCASEGLATGLREAIDRPPLAEALKLDTAQSVIMAQCVGYPRK